MLGSQEADSNLASGLKSAMSITIDYRERALSDKLEVEHLRTELPVGDILFRFPSGTEWIAERKSARDFASSIRCGRWSEQLSRLYDAGYQKVLFIIEGDLRGSDLGLPYTTLLSASLNITARPNSVLLRTWDITETAALVTSLAEKSEYGTSIPTGLAPPCPLTKRKRDADRHTVFKRQLMLLPSISEPIACKLVEHFGTLPALQEALRGKPKDFPRIDLGRGCFFGKARIVKLQEYLL